MLVCDDDLARTTFEGWFEADLEERRCAQGKAALRRLEVDGQVCRTLQELRDALDEAEEAGALPDLVLIDDRLQRKRGGESERSALRAVRLISSMFGDRRPRCVLHTGSPKPNDVWAFCELGGDNVVDKHRPLERAQILWQTLDGGRWTPPQPSTHVTLSDANGRLLPYMEEPYWKHNALQDLPDLTDAAANRAKSRLVTALGLMAGAEPREIVAAANDHGLVWVPLVSRHLLPEGHPEHRPTMFQHRSPGVSRT